MKKKPEIYKNMTEDKLVELIAKSHVCPITHEPITLYQKSMIDNLIRYGHKVICEYQRWQNEKET